MHVIVAGGGLAGLVAAAEALELSTRVTLLEKGDRLGGSLVYSSGYIWSYKDLPTFRRQAPGGDSILQRLVLERLEADLDWLEDHGVNALTRETGNPLTFGARFDPKQVVATLANRISASGGRMLLKSALASLKREEEGRLIGVQVVSDGERYTEGADAVILASGG
ncbi:MAG: NAD(P)/FAD-dependent oxidoreductase, partial [Actinomycetota bacterium]|nr:NAD(P)/FAD-dependent oxidoreductase [Actinomycetota bacterium]